MLRYTAILLLIISQFGFMDEFCAIRKCRVNVVETYEGVTPHEITERETPAKEKQFLKHVACIDLDDQDRNLVLRCKKGNCRLVNFRLNNPYRQKKYTSVPAQNKTLRAPPQIG